QPYRPPLCSRSTSSDTMRRAFFKTRPFFMPSFFIVPPCLFCNAAHMPGGLLRQVCENMMPVDEGGHPKGCTTCARRELAQPENALRGHRRESRQTKRDPIAQGRAARSRQRKLLMDGQVLFAAH